MSPSPPFRVAITRDDITPALAAAKAKLGHLAPLMRSVAGVLDAEAQQAFQDEADPTTGAPWPEYLHADDPQGYPDAYIHRPRPRGRGGERSPKLQVSGDLAKLYSESGPDFALIGSGEPQSALLMYGGTPDMAPGPAAVPARPYMGLSDAGAAEILDLTAAYLTTE